MRARTLVTGASVLEQLQHELGKDKVAVGPSLSLLDGLQAGRWLLEVPDTRFHVRCLDGIESLRAYQYDWDEETKAYSRKPRHDFTSHTADAWRYTAVVVKVTEMLQRVEPPKPPPKVRTLDSFTLDEIWEYADTPKTERIG